MTNSSSNSGWRSLFLSGSQVRIHFGVRCRDFIQLFTFLDVCVSSLRRDHANLLCILPSLTDDPRRARKESDSMPRHHGTPNTRTRHEQTHRCVCDDCGYYFRMRSTDVINCIRCYRVIGCQGARRSATLYSPPQNPTSLQTTLTPSPELKTLPCNKTRNGCSNVLFKCFPVSAPVVC